MVTARKNTSALGFGLVELIVSLSIVTIVTGIVIVRHNAFNGSILLRNQAYEIAFVIRQAQQLAVSGSSSTNLTSVQRQRYAVAFSTASTGVVNNQTLIIYKDNNNNGTYDTTVDGLIQTVRLDNRFSIQNISVIGTSRSSARILFERPSFDAKFYQGTSNVLQSGEETRIVVRPVGDASVERVIVVTASGQIRVE
jgi:Tfp pilus assembly protein FimT